MTTINLRDYYPFFNSDIFIEVSEEVAAALAEDKRREQSYQRRLRYHNAQYSLDAGDGIEKHALFFALSPCEVYERKLTMEQLYTALDALPEKQGRRIYARYILGLSQAEIALAEGVDMRNVRKSISRGLRSMEIFLKNL